MKSNGSKGRSKKLDEKKIRDLSRAIDAKVMARSKKVAAGYTVIIEPHGRLGFVANCVEMPNVFTHGETETKCIKTAREALAIAVAVMLEHGDNPPVPATENARDQQVNIRLTAKEKLLLESAAKREGYRGLSDFMRSVAMSQIRKSA
jgi:predicted RNase H-like HicB family nuclease